MQFTRFTDYGLRVLLMLAAAPDQRFSAEQIAQAYGISHHHLLKVINALAGHGFVHAIRGKGGGVELAWPAEEIVVGQVVRALEGPDALVECLGPQGACRIDGGCALKGGLKRALEAFYAVLDTLTLAEAAHMPGLRRQLGLTASIK